MGGLLLTASFPVDDYTDITPHHTLTSSPAVTSLVREHTMAYEEFSPFPMLPSPHCTLLALGPTAVLNMSARGTNIVVSAWDHCTANTIIRSALPCRSIQLYTEQKHWPTIITTLHQQTAVRLILKLIMNECVHIAPANCIQLKWVINYSTLPMTPLLQGSDKTRNKGNGNGETEMRKWKWETEMRKWKWRNGNGEAETSYASELASECHGSVYSSPSASLLSSNKVLMYYLHAWPLGLGMCTCTCTWQLVQY